MIRAACALTLFALAFLVAMLVRTDASTAIGLSFLGAPALALAIGLYAYFALGPVRMSTDEMGLYELAFSSLAKRDFLRLVALGAWQDVQPGARLIRKGDRPDIVWVLLRGRVAWEVDGRTVGELGPGQIVGSSLVLTGEESTGDAVAAEPARALAWPVETLGRVLEKRLRMRAAFQAIVSQDLARKVQMLANRSPGPGSAPG